MDAKDIIVVGVITFVLVGFMAVMGVFNKYMGTTDTLILSVGLPAIIVGALAFFSFKLHSEKEDIPIKEPSKNDPWIIRPIGDNPIIYEEIKQAINEPGNKNPVSDTVDEEAKNTDIEEQEEKLKKEDLKREEEKEKRRSMVR